MLVCPTLISSVLPTNEKSEKRDLTPPERRSCVDTVLSKSVICTTVENETGFDRVPCRVEFSEMADTKLYTPRGRR